MTWKYLFWLERRVFIGCVKGVKFNAFVGFMFIWPVEVFSGLLSVSEIDMFKAFFGLFDGNNTWRC